MQIVPARPSPHFVEKRRKSIISPTSLSNLLARETNFSNFTWDLVVHAAYTGHNVTTKTHLEKSSTLQENMHPLRCRDHDEGELRLELPQRNLEDGFLSPRTYTSIFSSTPTLEIPYCTGMVMMMCLLLWFRPPLYLQHLRCFLLSNVSAITYLSSFMGLVTITRR